MHWTATLRDQTLPPRSRIAVELRCRTCGYNLYRASPETNCPECSTPVRSSIIAATEPRQLGELLRRVAPTYLALFASVFLLGYWNGSWIVVIGGFCLILGSALRVWPLHRVRSDPGLQASTTAPARAQWLFVLAACEAVLTAALALVGLIGISAPDATVDAIFELLFLGWMGLVAIEIFMVGLLARSLTIPLDYAILRWESMGLLMLIALALAASGAIGIIATIRSGQLDVFAGSVIVGMMLFGIPATLLTTILLHHLANAALRTREREEDLLEPDQR